VRLRLGEQRRIFDFPGDMGQVSLDGRQRRRERRLHFLKLVLVLPGVLFQGRNS
jgi:hypothetical protein